jgi:WXG100 family type VII secretion target
VKPGGDFQADLDQLYAIQRMIDGVADRMEAGVVDLTKKMNPLLEGWEGATARIYQQEWGEWLEGATDVMAGLRNSVEALGTAARELQGTEETITSTFPAAKSVLNLGTP